MTTAKTTTDHNTIRQWVDQRDGQPARIRTEEEGGILRIDFAERDEELEPISWDEFFAIFDDNDLAFLHQDKTEDGKLSRFNKFVDRHSG